MNTIDYTVKPVKTHGKTKWGVFENFNLVYTCDDEDDAFHYMELYKMLMR